MYTGMRPGCLPQGLLAGTLPHAVMPHMGRPPAASLQPLQPARAGTQIAQHSP